MPWFPVDDGFYSHPKVLATSLAARGLWATAGSWCMDPAHLTDGVIPDHVLAALGGTPELAAELVTAGLWRRSRKGYAFHDWFQWGTKRTAEQQRELSATRAANGRKGGIASGLTRSANGVHSPKQTRSKPRFASDAEDTSPGQPTDGDQRKQASKPEANPKQVASQLLHGGLNPNTSSSSPLPPASGGHDGSHPNCRACGTNPRGVPPPEPPSAAARHPSAMTVAEATAAAGVTRNGRPARGEAVAAAAAAARAALHAPKGDHP